MSSISRFSVRSSGRDLTVVRRARPSRYVAPVPVESVALDEMLKSDLVSLAEARGVESSGTKADILARLSDD